jgi:hypothetical protein
LLPKQKKGGQGKLTNFDQFLQACVPQILTPKEQCFDMPNFLNYGSTGRPPGEYLRQHHLRHSLKIITDNLESPYPPPFDIFFIKTTNNDNNNNNNIYYNNGGTQTTINYNTSTYGDNREADTGTARSIHRTDNINETWFDLLFNNIDIDIASNSNNNNNNNINNNNNKTSLARRGRQTRFYSQY